MHARMPRHFFNVMHSIENEEICLFFFFFKWIITINGHTWLSRVGFRRLIAVEGKQTTKRKAGKKKLKIVYFDALDLSYGLGEKRNLPRSVHAQAHAAEWSIETNEKKKKTMLLSSENTYIFSSRFKRHMRHGNVWCIPQSVIQYNDLCVMSWFVLIPFDRSIQHKKYGNKAATPTYLNMWHSSGVQYPAMVKKWRQRKVQK